MKDETDYSLPEECTTTTKQELGFREPCSSSASRMFLSEGDSLYIADADYAGFANLSQQIYTKALRRGCEFTLMVVGESGLGKSTLINNLFLSDIYNKSDYPGPSKRIKKTVEIEQTKVLLVENGVKLYLTVVDVPGFGDALNNSGCWMPIVKFIDDRLQEYLDSQNQFHRGFIVDTRVHCCLYFVSNWGYGLKPLDIRVMKQLHERVNIIPIIAKADTFTPDERERFRQAITKQIEDNKIKIYKFPSYGSGDEIESTKNQFPLAVMGSLSMVSEEAKRGRRYPWGIAEVDNTEHCDFISLRNLLIRSHMYNMKCITNSQIYEKFRENNLTEIVTECNYLTKIQDEKHAHELKLKQMSEKMECVFNTKIEEKLQKIKELEAELEYRCQQLVESLQQEREDLEEKRKFFEKEKAEFFK